MSQIPAKLPPVASRPDNLEDVPVPQIRNDYYKTLIKEARKLETLGVVCVALKPGTKRPSGNGWQTRTKTNYSEFVPGVVGMGIVATEKTGISILDIDDVSAWKKLLQSAQKTGEDISIFDDIPCAKTPSGLHYYFKHSEHISAKAKQWVVVDEECHRINHGLDIDTRGNGGQCVAPPSLYCATKPEKKQYEGQPYKWLVSFDDIGGAENLSDMPDWLLMLIKQEMAVMKRDDGEFWLTPYNQEWEVQKMEIVKDELQAEYDAIADDGVYADGTGAKKVLNLEQIRMIVNAVNKSRVSGYDNWCKLLWAVARWQDETGADEDDTVDMLDLFSQQCEGYVSRSDVARKYLEAFKRNGRTSTVTLGTVISWLKEDNPAALANVFGMAKAKQQEEAAVLFNRDDPYCWVDFVNQHQEKVFDSREALDQSIRANLPRVLANIQKGNSFFLKKDNAINGLFTPIDGIIKGGNNFNVKYMSDKIDHRTKEKKIKKVIETVKFGTYLAEDGTLMKRYCDIGCYPDPSKCPPEFYNIWEGFQAKRVKEVDMSKIEELIYILRELWASGDEKLYKYILGWLRFIVGNPAEMTKVALFLYSKEGAGKGTFINFFMNYVLGAGTSFSYTGIEEVVEKHNTNIKGKKLLYVNEMGSTREQFISNFDKLKPIITDPKVKENPKNRAIVQVDNIANVIMSTNHKNSLYIPSEDNRRYTCIEVSDAKCGPEHNAWWGMVNKKIMDQDVANHFYTWLLDLDAEELGNPTVVFKTKLRDEIIETSRDNIQTFADWFVNEKEYFDDAERPEIVPASVLYSEYKSWCSAYGERQKSHTLFGAIMKGIFEFKKTKKCNMYQLPPRQIQPEEQN